MSLRSVCRTDPVPRDHRPRRPLPLHGLPVPRLDAVGPDRLRRHLHHPFRQLLLPRLPAQTRRAEGREARGQRQLRGSQRSQQGGGGGGERQEAKERESEKGVTAAQRIHINIQNQKKDSRVEEDGRRAGMSRNQTGFTIPARCVENVVCDRPGQVEG